MELALIFLPLALAGAALGRWSRWHPLLIGVALGILPGLFGLVAMAAFATEGGAILLFGGVAFVIGSAISALGAFIGWLRRTHLERTN